MAVKLKNKFTLEDGLASMIDLVFLLLVCFLVLIVLNPQRNILNLDLPTSSLTEQIDDNDLRVSIDKRLKFYVNGVLTDKSQLKSKLQLALNKKRSKSLVVSADRSVPFGYFADIVVIGQELQLSLLIEYDQLK